MPKVYEYMGIIFSFYTNEHLPPHVHAQYQGNEIKITFFMDNGKITRTTYKNVRGKFPPGKIKTLKKFVSHYKYRMAKDFNDMYFWKINPKFEKITKKLK